jgi:hypothetical protein
MIDAADFTQLGALETQFSNTVEKLFPGTCSNCGSHNVTRASAAVATTPTETKKTSIKDFNSNKPLVNFG